jgi:hypothetical protein
VDPLGFFLPGAKVVVWVHTGLAISKSDMNTMNYISSLCSVSYACSLFRYSF